MKEQYNFSDSIKNPFVNHPQVDPGKVEVSLLLDSDVVSFLKRQCDNDYQEFVNKLLRTYMAQNR